jgi:hypothetical protein
VAVDVPGGRLMVILDDEACWLAGPAVIVATGTVAPEALDVRLPGPDRHHKVSPAGAGAV